MRKPISVVCAGCSSRFDSRAKYPKYCSKNCYFTHRIPWQKGLTKFTDARIAKLADSVKKNHHDVTGENNPMFGKIGSLSPVWNSDRDEIEMRKKLRGMMKSCLRRALPISKVKKSRRTFEMLGFTAEQLREHLESLFTDGMSWKNYGDGPGRWHIDHVRPIASFDSKTSPAEISALSNLRPLWSNENHRKSAKWQG